LILSLFIEGKPQPAGSRTVGRRKDGSVFTRPASKGLPAWQKTVAEAVRTEVADVGIEQLGGPVRVELNFRLARPKSHFGSGRNSQTLRRIAPPLWHEQKPDADKLVRAVLDACTSAGIWKDDSQVAVIDVVKVWCQPGQPEGVAVRVSPLVSEIAPETL